MTNSTTRSQRVLVVGLGISGIATALRLHRLGWKPVVVERAPTRRQGGYFIGLFGTGKASAARLGVLESILNRQHPRSITYELDRAGHHHKGMSFVELPGMPYALLRGDVEDGLFRALPEEVEIRFSTVPTRIVQDEHGVDVTMTHTKTGMATTERFELVVGADGMRSTVRQLVFGPPEDFLHPMNYMIAASILSKPIAGFSSHDGLILAEAGRSAWVFPFANHNPAVLFSYRADDIDAQFRRRPIESLREAFGPQPAGSVLGQLLDDFGAANEYLFDSVNQVRMERWHKGRVVLVGDSAWCLTLYSGMGASSGMAGAELLGNMLEKYPDNLGRALVEWEARLRPFIEYHQSQAWGMRRFFTPAGEAERAMRATIIKAMGLPIIGPFITKMNQGGRRRRMQMLDIAAP
ncbi:FAD-dependent oxidoreductase [Archangium violaceum]|uniref:FAD-dependent monooxygenase n=1 Tax=Archangium violaceum TaxID=83451 RepID=UPI002B3233C2|nr:FAD-dependent oxidoreductase [Archangium violaceum]